MFRLISLLSLFLVLLCAQFQAQAAERFYLNVIGSTSQIESVKKRSEYRMTKNVDYCRGVKMPKPTAGWLCQSNNRSQTRCSRQYECTFVDNKFNRKTESLRAYRAMKGMPAITRPYSIALSAKPKVMTNVRPVKKVVAKKAAPKVVATPVPVATPKAEVMEDDLFAELESQEVAPEQPEEKADILDEAFADENPVKQEESYQEPSESYESSWNWLRFDGFLTQTSDETGSQTAFEAGWRPRWNFSKNWSLEARLGLSQRKPVADTDEEPFSVLEMGAWLGRRFGNWRLAAGFGRQSWSGEGEIGEQTPTFYSASAAYYWSDVKFYVIEGVEFQYLSLSDEASSTAMRLGFLINF